VPVHFVSRSAHPPRLDLVGVERVFVDRDVRKTHGAGDKLSGPGAIGERRRRMSAEVQAAATLSLPAVPILRLGHRSRCIDRAVRARVIISDSLEKNRRLAVLFGSVVIAPFSRSSGNFDENNHAACSRGTRRMHMDGSEF